MFVLVLSKLLNIKSIQKFPEAGGTVPNHCPSWWPLLVSVGGWDHGGTSGLPALLGQGWSPGHGCGAHGTNILTAS